MQHHVGKNFQSRLRFVRHHNDDGAAHVSQRAPESIVPPSDSIALAICGAVIVSVPLVKSEPVMLAVPPPSGSTSAPLRTRSSAASKGNPALRYHHAQAILQLRFLRLDESDFMRFPRSRRRINAADGKGDVEAGANARPAARIERTLITVSSPLSCRFSSPAQAGRILGFIVSGKYSITTFFFPLM